MKKIIYSLITVGLLLTATPAFAEESNSTGKSFPVRMVQGVMQQIRDFRSEKKGEVKDLREDMKATLASSTREKKDELQNFRGDLRALLASSTREKKGAIREEVMKRLEHNKYLQVVRRFKAALERELDLTARFQSRIDKVKAAGGATDPAQKLVDSAKTHFDMAQTALDNLSTSLLVATGTNATTTTTVVPKNVLDALKKASKEVEKHIKEGHSDLVKALGALKGMSSATHATSTDSHTEDNDNNE
jgi:hypothetical protein